MSSPPGKAESPTGNRAAARRRHRWTPVTGAGAADTTRVEEFDTGHPGAGGVTKGRVVLAEGSPSTIFACIHSVPGLMTATDFCMFVRPAADSLLHIRMLRPTSELNSYMVLAKFRNVEDSQAFATAYEGKPFLQGLIKDVCCVSAVKSAAMDGFPPVAAVDLDADGNPPGRTPPSFPARMLFPSSADGPGASPGAAVDAGEDIAGPYVASSPNAGPRAPCPVCLEPLDCDTSSLVTTLCNHTMHTACLAQWGLDSCPVCRHTHELTPEASSCMSCGHTRGLWMCVVCAYVGCGVYTNKHAQSHFEDSHHPFAVILEDSTFFSGDVIKAGAVWDYVSNRFVHRLLSSEDGKVVEVSDARGQQASGGGSLGNERSGGERDDAARSSAGAAGAGGICGKPVRTRCCARATSGSDDDDEDDRGLRAALYASRLDAEVGDLRAKIEVLEKQNAAAALALEASVESEQLKQAKASQDEQLMRRLKKAEKENKELREKNSFLKSLNESVLRDKQTWGAEVQRISQLLAEKEKECGEKEEQLRDLYMHLQAQTKVAEASAGCRADAGGSSDASGGDILGIGPPPKQKLASKARRRKQ
jgi:BRCA1-associated protein